MSSVKRGAAVMVALFAAIPIFLIVSLVTWELLLIVNNGFPLDTGQIFLALFSGFSFGLAAFSFVYATRLVEE
ncbi:MAG: hypothetical protein ACK2UR_10465 [Candidatus Promineifilaceae bacterium]